MQILDIPAIHEDIDLFEQFTLVGAFAFAHELLPRVARPAPNVLGAAEPLPDLA